MANNKHALRSTRLALIAVLGLVGCHANSAFDAREASAMRAEADRRPLVVFISGYGVEASTWQPLEKKLASIASTFAFQRPGYGGTPLASTDADGVRTADEVAVLLDTALKERDVRHPIILVAHSLGGAICAPLREASSARRGGDGARGCAHEGLYAQVQRGRV